MTPPEVLVLGGGLSGLATALLLTEQGLTVKVLEAHSQAGGRIKSHRDTKYRMVVGDLGPTWIWPDYQPTARRWVEKLGLSWLEQFTDGLALFDHSSKNQASRVDLPGQLGIMRLEGGTQTLIDSLLRALPESSVECGFPIKKVEFSSEKRAFSVLDDKVRRRVGDYLVCAIPPRVAASSIQWKPSLSDSLLEDLVDSPTWMSSQAKVVIRYSHAFWKEQGLSGRIASRVGPIVEGHDHCSADGKSSCLFGFLGWPVELRAETVDSMEAEIRAQMRRCFGPEAPEPVEVIIKDWALDPRVCQQRDLDEVPFHPEVRPARLRKSYFQGHLVFAGSETSRSSPGLIEGALHAAERAASQVIQSSSKR